MAIVFQYRVHFELTCSDSQRELLVLEAQTLASNKALLTLGLRTAVEVIHYSQHLVQCHSLVIVVKKATYLKTEHIIRREV